MEITKGESCPSIVVSKIFFGFIIVLLILLVQIYVFLTPIHAGKNICLKTNVPLPLEADDSEQKDSEQKDKEYEITDEQRYYPIIVKVSLEYKIDPLLVKAVIVAESGFDTNAVSRVGAEGLMQLMPRTAKYLGVEDSFNPEHNIYGGVKYLKRLLDKYNGNIEFALAAYNAGARNVFKYKGVPPYAETKKYIKKVSALHEMYKKLDNSTEKELMVSQI